MRSEFERFFSYLQSHAEEFSHLTEPPPPPEAGVLVTSRAATLLRRRTSRQH
jgi:hypothetical protein